MTAVTGADIATEALRYRGVPYRWGGYLPQTGWDCCIVAGVRVYGPRGAIPIEDIRAGDLVYSYHGGRRVTSKVLRQWKSRHQPVFHVRTRNRTVTASANHPFLRLVRVEKSRPTTGRKRFPSRYETEWVQLDQLARGDLLVQPRSLATEPIADMPVLASGVAVDADVAWLLGAITGDGNVTAKGLNLALYGGRRERATAVIAARWGCQLGHSAKHGLWASSAALRDDLTVLGMRRPGPAKRVPEAVWAWPPELQQAFLDGYCDADGHRPADPARHGERTYHSASRELIEDARALHICLGHAVSNITTTRRTKPIVIKGKTVVNARDQHAFTVWRSGSHKGTWACKSNEGIRAWITANPDFIVTRLLAVTPAGEQDTWDLEIEESHSFIADGLVVHNSGFVNYVLGNRFGFVLPGGLRWSGSFHGPVAAMYKTWSKATTVGQASPGVLCCWITHVGIAVNDHQMISAYDVQLGTAVTGFSGPPGEPLSFRQVSVAAVSAAGPAAGGNVLPGCLPGLVLMPFCLARGVMFHGRAEDESAGGGD